MSRYLQGLLLEARTPDRLTIGIAGGSGSGKSTIAASIVEGLQPRSSGWTGSSNPPISCPGTIRVIMESPGQTTIARTH